MSKYQHQTLILNNEFDSISPLIPVLHTQKIIFRIYSKTSTLSLDQPNHLTNLPRPEGSTSFNPWATPWVYITSSAKEINDPNKLASNH